MLKKEGRGRPKGSLSSRVGKTQASISMSAEAWAILTKRAKDLGVYKSDYIENLVRRGDNVTYDLSISFLIEMVVNLEKDIISLELTKVELQEKAADIRKFLREIGVSPNIMP